MTRFRGRVDANQRDIQRAVESVGASWLSLADLGHGAPDALVGWHGENRLWEIKDGSKPPSARALTADEQRWHDTWHGQVEIIETREDALASLGVRPRPQEKRCGDLSKKE